MPQEEYERVEGRDQGRSVISGGVPAPRVGTWSKEVNSESWNA